MSKLIINTRAECITPEPKIRVKHPSSPLRINLPYNKKTIQHEKRLANKASQKNKIVVRMNCGCYGKLQGNKYTMASVCLTHAHSNVADIAAIVEYTIRGNLGIIDYITDSIAVYGYTISQQNGLSVPLSMIGMDNSRQYKIKKASPKKEAAFLMKK